MPNLVKRMDLYKSIWAVRACIYRLFFSKLGFPSYFGKPIYIRGWNRIRFGNRFRIFPGARIEAHGNGQIIVGDNVSIGQNLHLVACKNITIQDNALIAENVFISDCDHRYEDINSSVTDQGLTVNETFIGKNAFIGFSAVILAGTILGRNTTIAANSVVRGKFPDYCVLAGCPARIVKRYSFEKREWTRKCKSSLQ